MEGELTDLLGRWGQDDDDAQQAFWPLVYNELRRMAGELMRGERTDHTLQPTALVNEAYFKLAKLERIRFRNRGHFYAVAARMMRRILVDHARARETTKRDGGDRLTLDTVVLGANPRRIEILDLDNALSRLETMDPEKARVVELKFFCGMTNNEVANTLECSDRTATRHWRVAKLWLHRELSNNAVR